MVKRLLPALKHLGYAASFLADVPPLLVWLYHHSQWLVLLITREPIGALALLCAIVVAIGLVRLAKRVDPPIL